MFRLVRTFRVHLRTERVGTRELILSTCRNRGQTYTTTKHPTCKIMADEELERGGGRGDAESGDGGSDSNPQPKKKLRASPTHNAKLKAPKPKRFLSLWPPFRRGVWRCITSYNYDRIINIYP